MFFCLRMKRHKQGSFVDTENFVKRQGNKRNLIEISSKCDSVQTDSSDELL